MKKGRPVSSGRIRFNCKKCNVKFTNKNGYKRKSGVWCTLCKECDRLRLYEYNWNNKSKKIIALKILEHNKKNNILSKILNKRDRNNLDHYYLSTLKNALNRVSLSTTFLIEK